MSYVLDVRELLHKLPFHHFTPYELKNSCISIGITYALPGVIGAGVSAFYYFSFTVKDKLIFENTNVNEHKTRAMITLGVIAAFVPAALIGLIEGFGGSMEQGKTIEGWATEAQSGLATYGASLMAMDDSLVRLKVEATEASDVSAQATLASALATLKTVLINHGAASEFSDEIEYFKWFTSFQVSTGLVSGVIALTLLSLLSSALLPIYSHYGKRPVSTWWDAAHGRMTPEHFVRSVPLWTLMYCFLVTAVFWPLSVIGAEMCYAYDLMVEFQLPESAQFFFLCPKFGYELGETMATLIADKTSLNTAISSVEDLGGSYATSTYMSALKSAETSFETQYARINEGFGDCQPMSDTVELTIHELCDEVMIGIQMFTAVAFGLTCLLMYGTLHRWFGSDVAKELIGDEEKSLFMKLTSDTKLQVKSKFGSAELTAEELEKKAAAKKAKKAAKKQSAQRTWKRGAGESTTTTTQDGGEDSPDTSESDDVATGEGSPSVASPTQETIQEEEEEDDDDASETGGDDMQSIDEAGAVDIQMTDFLNDDRDFESGSDSEVGVAGDKEDPEFTDPNFGETRADEK